MIRLAHLTPAAEEGWWLLFELTEADSEGCLLIGGQMMQLLAAEHGVSGLVRPTDDVDVVVDVRLRPGGTEWLAGWLQDRGFALEGVSAEGVGHRFARKAEGGPGTTIVDVLAPERVGARAGLFTVRPAHTVQAPGARQAFERSELVEVAVAGMLERGERIGRVRRPKLLGALILKAAATSLPNRDNPERDWQDAALLLSAIPDPAALRDACSAADRRRLRNLLSLRDREHPGWATLDDDAHRRGVAALEIIMER